MGGLKPATTNANLLSWRKRKSSVLEKEFRVGAGFNPPSRSAAIRRSKAPEVFVPKAFAINSLVVLPDRLGVLSKPSRVRLG
jgi:hypothetical protein